MNFRTKTKPKDFNKKSKIDTLKSFYAPFEGTDKAPNAFKSKIFH